nr:HK97-gp10 family putative phage morphogenesis protein [uncultured Romboutsia sp.]
MGIKCTGMDQLLNKFQELEKKAQRNIADKALDKASDIVKSTMIDLAPEDTGALKSAIDKGNLKGSGTNRKIEVGNINGDSEVTRYWYYQENGTTVMNPTKFTKKSFQNSVSDANEVIKQVIIEELR